MKKTSTYTIFLHIALVALCGVTIALAAENRKMKRLLQPMPNGPTIGQSLEDLRWQPLDADETTFDLTSATSDSLLFIFTTDCPACRETQSAWRSVQETVGDSFEIAGISLSGREATRSYRDSLALPFSVGVPADPQRFIDSLSISGVPLTVRIGPDGRVKGKWSGTLSASQLSEIMAP